MYINAVVVGLFEANICADLNDITYAKWKTWC